MKKKPGWINIVFVCILLFIYFLTPLLSAAVTEEKGTVPAVTEIEKNVQEWMKAGKIPGLTLVIIRGDEPAFIKGYGWADPDTKTPVTGETLFELASCSKSFTALAALHLEEKGLIKLDSPVSDYLPWFYVTFNNQTHKITLRQLLHHTSGIPNSTLSLIPGSSNKDALEQTVRNIVGVRLNRIPGEGFEYATINYDILGAVIEKVSGKSFEEYMENYLFAPMGLTHTRVGVKKENPLMATGYKIGFFQPRKYDPPIFRGNNPAGYIVSNGKDIARWLRFQLGLAETDFAALVKKSREPDLTVPPFQNTLSYAMGWFVNPFENDKTFHGGFNPNFTAFIGFRPGEKIGAAVLANCNSRYTQFIGHSVIKLLTGEEVGLHRPSGDKVDAFCSITSIVLGIYILLIIIFILVRIVAVFKRNCQYEGLSWKKVLRMVVALLGSIPFLSGIYLIPGAVANLSWEIAPVWAPGSFKAVILLLLSSLGISYLLFVFSLIYPTKNKYRNELPLITVISILSGLSGTVLLFLITTSFISPVGLGYLLYYFGLVYLLHIGGRKIAQTKVINITNNIALDLRIDLINKLFSTRYHRFENIHDGRILTTLNDDTGVLARSATLFLNFVTTMITLISGFIYMITISVISSLIVAAVIFTMIIYFRLVAKKSRVYMEIARSCQNVYMSLLNGLIRGNKELSIHRRKKYEFRKDLVDTSSESCRTSITAAVRFLNAELIGESIAFVVLGILSIVVSRVITGINVITLISFVMVLLYLMGPIRSIINVIPALTRIRVSWDRIKGFVKDLDIKDKRDSVKELIKSIDLPENQEENLLKESDLLQKNVENLKVRGLMFEYEPPDEEHEKGFSVGPIDFEVNKGESLFIVGGNGSGKTTVAKLITGLYICDEGSIKINDIEISDTQIGEYFTTIFSNYFLFKKIYGIDLDKKEPEIQKYLNLLNLQSKVQLEKGEYSTLDLSGGQRKRLALLQCYLEDRPIFLFDEVAADQDPEFRRFFYRELLPQMKEQGKLVIAITHDDHYFDVADKIIKMDMGKIDMLDNRWVNYHYLTQEN